MISNRGTHLHRSPTTGRIQKLPNTDNHKKAPTSRTSSALFSSDKDLIGIFTNPSSNKSNSLNQGMSQKENTSSDARLSDYSTAIESGNSSSTGNNYTTDYQCTVHNQFGVLDVDTHNSFKETPSSYSSALQKPSNAKQGEYSVGKQAANLIPVVILENRPKRSDSREKGPPTRDGYYNSELRAPDEGDGDFETFFRRRTQRFYLDSKPISQKKQSSTIPSVEVSMSHGLIYVDTRTKTGLLYVWELTQNMDIHCSSRYSGLGALLVDVGTRKMES